MKILIKIMYVFAFLLVMANFNSLFAQEKSLTELWITNPTCCPPAGTCGANHPIIGPANSELFYGNGQFREIIGWDTQFPSGTSIVHYWATTMTVEVPDATYNAMYCHGETDEEIGYGFNLSAYLTTSPVYIFWGAEEE